MRNIASSFIALSTRRLEFADCTVHRNLSYLTFLKKTKNNNNSLLLPVHRVTGGLHYSTKVLNWCQSLTHKELLKVGQTSDQTFLNQTRPLVVYQSPPLFQTCLRRLFAVANASTSCPKSMFFTNSFSMFSIAKADSRSCSMVERKQFLILDQYRTKIC